MDEEDIRRRFEIIESNIKELHRHIKYLQDQIIEIQDNLNEDLYGIK
jgi:hypothetical protein